jgi:hypothetical protein
MNERAQTALETLAVEKEGSDPNDTFFRGHNASPRPRSSHASAGGCHIGDRKGKMSLTEVLPSPESGRSPLNPFSEAVGGAEGFCDRPPADIWIYPQAGQYIRARSGLTVSAKWWIW